MKLIIMIILLSFIPIFTFGQDWVNAERFKNENEKLGLPKPNEKRIVFMGNSITEGWSKFYPAFFSGKNYINRGISGQTTPQMLLRFRNDVINLKPKLVILLAGTNDIAGNTGFTKLDAILNNIISMTELAKANNIQVILSSVLPVFDYPWKTGINPAEKIDSLNGMIKYYADRNKIPYLNYYSSMVDERKGLKSEYSEDGVHPNETGYKIMSKLAEEVISNFKFEE